MMWLALALFLFALQVAMILIAQFRHPAKGIAWLTILFMLPIVGFLIYYFIAQEYRQRKVAARRGRSAAEQADLLPIRNMQRIERIEQIPNAHIQGERRFFGLLASFPESDMTACNDAALLGSAEELYQLMLRDIEQAKHHIHMLYYIWNDDESGRRFQELLIRKALEGVEVRVIYDGIGAYSTPERFWEELRAAGVRTYCFLPAFIAFFDRRVNYRNHRKITVVDGEIGYIGGINIGDEYVGKDKKLGYWRDTAVRLTGDAVYDLQRTFAADWLFVSGEKMGRSERLYPKHEVQSRGTVQIVTGGPDSPWDTIVEMYFTAFSTAKERIYATTPYLIPDRSLVMALRTAALAGVDVRLVIPGIADSKLTLWASLSYLEELLQAGVRIYRYGKGFMHAKTVIVDRIFATTGTANMDLRSFYSNFEINAVFFDEQMIEQFVSHFRQDLLDSVEVLPDEFLRRSRWQKAKEAVGRLLSPLL